MHAKYNRSGIMTGLSARERGIMDAFVASEKSAITADALLTVYPTSRPTANQMLSRLNRKGWLQRITRGVYAIVPLGSSSPQPAIENIWPLAMQLFAPCYIAGWSAAEYWELTEQIFNDIAIVTAQSRRRSLETMGGVTFRIRSVKTAKLFGTKRIWLKSQTVEIADMHRLVVDILDDPALGGGGRHTLDILRNYWTGKKSDAKKLMEYAIKYRRGTVFKRLGFTAEIYSREKSEWIRDCQKRISSGISKLDPDSPARGPIVSRWNLQINIPIE